MILPYLEWLALLSIFTFVLSILTIPWYLAKLPQDFFLQFFGPPSPTKFGPSEVVLFFARNLAGIVLITAGFIMLFLPGQGILTIVIGLLIMSFPGKRHLLLYLLSKPTVQNSLDWARKKMHRLPFRWHE